MTLRFPNLWFTAMVGAMLAAEIVSDNGCRAHAEEANWPCFRGTNRTGVSKDEGLPLEWSGTNNVVWKTELPGAGASSPITFGDRVYLTCFSGYGLNRETPGKVTDLRRHVVCLSRNDGRIHWNAVFPNTQADDHYGDFINMHGYASSTPAADESGVYTFFGTTGIRAYDHEGNLKWEQTCGAKYSSFGSGSSPVLFGDLVIINASIEGQSLIAFDKTSGREAWRVAVYGHTRSTPLVLTQGDGHELVFHLKATHEGNTNQGIVAAIDPRNGNKLWECQGLDNYLVPSPIAGDGVIFALGNYPNRAMAIRTGGRGNVTDSHKLWEIKHGSAICTPVLHQGHLYWTDEDNGIAFCVEAATGKLTYQERLQPRPGRIYASGVIADGKLYYVSRENGTYVLSAEPKYKLLAHNTIETDTSVFNATPAVSRKQLLLRSDKYLYCIGK
jgi:outer membrane protein assembly factor BamB